MAGNVAITTFNQAYYQMFYFNNIKLCGLLAK